VLRHIGGILYEKRAKSQVEYFNKEIMPFIKGQFFHGIYFVALLKEFLIINL
jgi:hypothetical protein